MLQELLARVQAINEDFLKKGSTAVWYRGHRKNEWKLKSTLHRHLDRLTSDLPQPLSPELMKETLREEAKTLYRRFQVEAWPLLRETERSDWGVLLAMQHYRLPTRFLDWTESFACALFFAQRGRAPRDTAAIWVLDGQRMNEVSLGHSGLVALDENVVAPTNPPDLRQWHPKYFPEPEDSPTIAVSPIFTNPRMTAQRSVFTLAGDSLLPLDEQFDGRLVRDGILVQIELPPAGFEEVENYLRLNGLRAFTYFPDLEGLAQDHEARVEETLSNIRKHHSQLLKKKGE